MNDAYQRGIDDAEEGLTTDDCPYDDPHDRHQWIRGFGKAVYLKNREQGTIKSTTVNKPWNSPFRTK